MSPTQKKQLQQLSRRERQIMDAIYVAGSATVSEVREALDDAPSYSAVRTLLGILEDKGLLKHEQRGARYIYSPRVSKRVASRSAMRRLVDTFFGGSVGHAAVALIDDADDLSEAELDALQALIDRARREGGK